ncbi:YcaO-like family protein [Rhizobium sp. Root1220]|uniref:YcaO-like family protein n=1 Tax=Rhizobium sp. Root1220 TaxID=1736432 RepID=UPI0006FECBDE|nr:YcaO-like family protein [Rhizobium sp. Root1220]KQV81469.1 hypothetical protein ASC90_03895 [Rhizobium sp. Root1220]
MSSAQTLARIMPILADFGVTRLARHTGLDFLGIPVWCAFTPNARSIVVAQGKGLSDDDAKVSAAMEALERAVASDPAVSPVKASARQLQDSGHTVDTLEVLIGLHKDDIELDDELQWALARDLLTGAETYVPFEATLLDRTRDTRFWMSSDGLASGNTLEEATFHGILERIERDAQVLWRIADESERYSRCVDPCAFGDPALLDLIGRIEAAGLSLRLFDITSDVTIPCFTAILGPCAVQRDRHIRFVEVTGGSGAHPYSVRAAIRAITEAAQSRLTYIGGARDDISPNTFLMPLPEEIRRAFDAKPAAPATGFSMEPKSLSEHLDNTLNALRERQIGSVLVVPLSDPGLPFSVAKVFVPDLENPDGKRARRYGARAISKALGP